MSEGGMAVCDCRLAEHGLHRLGCPERMEGQWILGLPDERCASVNGGDRCDLLAAHEGQHEHTESRRWTT